MAMVSFGTLFALGIAKIKRPESHKRLILFATCMLLNAAVGRLYRPMFAPMPPPPWLVFVTVDSILVACLVYDWKTRGRPHPVTVAAGSVLVGLQIIRFLVPGTELWRSIYDRLLLLVA
jgi:hypothetical protein